MFRVSVLTLVLVLVAACAAPVQQQAGARAPAVTASDGKKEGDGAADRRDGRRDWPPRMPCAGNFEEVPLGKWADYEETYLDAATIKERVALVAEAEAVTLETTTETKPGDRTVFATCSRRPTRGWRVTSNVFQVADDDRWSRRRSGPRSSRTRASTGASWSGPT